jgi:site-specific DNA-methyltransferase (adenine-specific)
MNIEYVNLTQIKPYISNAKKHDKKQVKAVADSIKRFGWAQPLVIDKNNELIIGHCRLEAAKTLQELKVPVTKMDNLTEQEVKALRLADNKLNESPWDMKLVIPELKLLDAPLLELTGFDKDLIIEGTEQDDKIPENVESVCKTGDLWQLGEHRLLCGDSTKKEDVERLMEGQKADMVLQDPPYGVLNNKWDRPLLQKDIDIALEYSTGAIFMFNATKIEIIKNILNFNPSPERMMVWRLTSSITPKGKGMFWTWQPIFVWRGKNVKGWDSIDFQADSPDKTGEHPTQKPIKLLENIIKNTLGVIVADLFGGSGSTLIACEKLNRKCRMMELDEHYCDGIIKRWEDFTNQEAKKI